MARKSKPCKECGRVHEPCRVCGKRHHKPFNKCARSTALRLLREAVAIRDKGIFNPVCQICFRELGEDESWEMHHVVKVSADKRLRNCLDNVIVVHNACHWAWHNDESTHVVEFARRFPDRWDHIQEVKRRNKREGTILQDEYLAMIEELRTYIEKGGGMPRVNKVHGRVETTGTESNLVANCKQLAETMAGYHGHLDGGQVQVCKATAMQLAAFEKLVDEHYPMLQKSRQLADGKPAAPRPPKKTAAKKDDAPKKPPKRRGRPKKVAPPVPED